MELTERLNKIFKHYNMTKYSEFAEKTGLSHQVSSNYLKGKQKPDAERLIQIIQSFDEINVEWLMLGKGEMLKKDDKRFNDEEKNILDNITKDLSKVDIENIVRFISYNDEELMKNPIFENYINKKGYKIALDILSKNK